MKKNVFVPPFPIAVFIVLSLFLPAAAVSQELQAPVPGEQLPTTPVAVDDAELSIFAATLLRIRDLGMSAQQDIADRVGKSDLSNERFVEIYESDQMLGAGEPAEVTEAERTEFDLIMRDIEILQTAYEADVDAIMTESGITPERFDEIYIAAQTDFDLQERLKPLLAPAAADPASTP